MIRTRLFALVAGSMVVAACASSSSTPSTDGGSSSTTPPDLSGSWSGTINWTTTSAIFGSGTTTITFTIGQAADSTTVTFTAQPTEANGVHWTCPAGTIDGTKVSFPSACTLANGSCTSSATPVLTVTPASGSGSVGLSWEGYSYTWAGSSCIGKGVTVTVPTFALERGTSPQ